MQGSGCLGPGSHHGDDPHPDPALVGLHARHEGPAVVLRVVHLHRRQVLHAVVAADGPEPVHVGDEGDPGPGDVHGLDVGPPGGGELSGACGHSVQGALQAHTTWNTGFWRIIAIFIQSSNALIGYKTHT